MPADFGGATYSPRPRGFSILPTMPTQVIVVQRPRRSLFAVPRALPDWLRSVWAALLPTPVEDTDLADLRMVDLRTSSAPLFPQLALDATGSHRCVACDLCVRVCPSRCLEITTEGEDRDLRVTRFDFVRGACIGCGLCGQACPEGAIEMASGGRVEVAPLSGLSHAVDLLIDRPMMKG